MKNRLLSLPSLLLAFSFCAILPCRARAGAPDDWKKITAMDAGPEGNAPTRDAARQLMIALFDRQETALRAYIAAYPADEHAVEARLRLSHLLAVRSELEGKTKAYTESLKILENLDADPSLPADKKADVSFARITLYMHRVGRPDATQREALTDSVHNFQKKFPGDKRNGALLAEVASLYDSDPKTKRDLLTEAFRYADEDLKMRINDDFKRLDLVGKPLALKFNSAQGAPVDIADYKGKVVLVYFFANWSSPSVAGLAEVKRIASNFPAAEFQVVGISLDKDQDKLQALLTKTGIRCPVYFDGKGWESPLARSLGINALPTAWLIDRAGNLRYLNAMDNTEAMIRELLGD